MRGLISELQYAMKTEWRDGTITLSGCDTKYFAQLHMKRVKKHSPGLKYSIVPVIVTEIPKRPKK